MVVRDDTGQFLAAVVKKIDGISPRSWKLLALGLCWHGKSMPQQWNSRGMPRWSSWLSTISLQRIHLRWERSRLIRG